MTHKKRGRIFREKRQDNAAGLKEARSKLSSSEQIKVLDRRLGVGVGAAKERARLAKDAK
jgi:hypothetical protein